MGVPRLVAKALETRFWDGRPFILSHLLTARCNADCITCLWKMPADSQTDELTTEQVARLYQDAAATGFLSLVMWGGEPMLRQDAGSLLATAHRLGLNTTLITNGFFLADGGHSALPHTDRLLVSVDALDDRLDEIRRCAGLFERIREGLELCRADYPKVRIVVLTVVSKLNLDQLEPVAAFGQRFNAQVILQAMNFSDYGFADRRLDLERVKLEPEDELSFAREVERLQRAGYPVRDSNAYLSRLGSRALSYRCHYKKVVMRIEPNGDVLDCTQRAVPMINVRTTRLSDFVASPALAEFCARAENCNRCRDAGVLEVSHIWEGRAAALINAVRGLR